jgi:hypothetical protein
MGQKPLNAETAPDYTPGSTKIKFREQSNKVVATVTIEAPSTGEEDDDKILERAKRLASKAQFEAEQMK